MENAAAAGSAFYSGRGDDGRTGLLGPGRVPKYDLRPEAYGTVDEAQAALGLARAASASTTTRQILLALERDLYTLMAELAAAGHDDSPFAGRVQAADVARLEDWIARVEAGVEMPADFVLPGDTLPGAALHLARTVVRRAERGAVRLADEGLLRNREVVRYLNRLSSLLYVLALCEDTATGGPLTLAPDRR
ncbi:MAG: cob(I)yrinic acid a,c-diamide adenosyltransferase [Anaerolineae bacterium]|nr:cob(I)yrinic acid a,c-diamide adenosyltransferase [Anaerolineae bacterium]